MLCIGMYDQEARNKSQIQYKHNEQYADKQKYKRKINGFRP